MIRNWEDIIVVIAEDEQINFLFLKAVLKPTKAKIIWTKTGRETIDVCNSEKVDIILMDIKMPDLNGLEATSEIKKTFPNLPIIAQTAYAMEEDEEASIEAGCNDYISKPIRPERLLTIMSKYIKIK
ncbi:MAG: response regulator [Bacteroidales bacterium]|jgi:two-component system cell cycle response regulator DivK|nr:response regulator [Bacteroidales bacterium]